MPMWFIGVPARRVRAAALVGVVSVAGAGGCGGGFTKVPAEGVAGEALVSVPALGPDAWPERWTAGLPEYREINVVSAVFGRGGPRPVIHEPVPAAVVTQIGEDEWVLGMPVTAEVVGRVWARYYGERVWARSGKGEVGISVWHAAPSEADSSLALPPPPPPPEERTQERLFAWLDRTWEAVRELPFKVRFYLQHEAPGASKGLAVYLHSVGGHSNERAIIEAMLARGWSVLYIGAVQWADPDAVAAHRARLSGGVDGGAYAGMTPEEVARATDNLFADMAYSVEAAAMLAHRDDPALFGQPVVIIGTSLGAMLAPAVAARLREAGFDVEAVALIGGGADFWRVERMSGLGVFEYDLSDDGSGRPPWERYLAASRLDPYHVAPTLRGVPTLVVQARADRIVRTELGDVLWERLGRPERWLAPGGHYGLIWNLPKYADDVAEWVEGAVEGRGADKSGG